MTSSKRPRRVTLADVAEKAGVSITTAGDILSHSIAPYNRNTRKRVFAAAKALGYDRARRKERRSAERKELNIPTWIEIILRDGSRFSVGKATLKNLSLTGALLDSIKTEPRVLPNEPFTVCLVTKHGLYRKATPVRFHIEGDYFALGVRFLPVNKRANERLTEYLALAGG